LFHWASSDHDDGGETVFLSGEFGPLDFVGPVPEPSVLAFAGIAGFALLSVNRKRTTRSV
jgi:hypothetical protein